jgi:hypothetical protein
VSLVESLGRSPASTSSWPGGHAERAPVDEQHVVACQAMLVGRKIVFSSPFVFSRGSGTAEGGPAPCGQLAGPPFVPEFLRLTPSASEIPTAPGTLANLTAHRSSAGRKAELTWSDIHPAVTSSFGRRLASFDTEGSFGDSRRADERRRSPAGAIVLICVR